LALAPILCGIALHAEPVFYAISGDIAGVPRQFDAISIAGAGSVSSPFNLGDGSVGFTGGLTYRASDNRFYAIYSDSGGLARCQRAFQSRGLVSTMRVVAWEVNSGVALSTDPGGPSAFAASGR